MKIQPLELHPEESRPQILKLEETRSPIIRNNLTGKTTKEFLIRNYDPDPEIEKKNKALGKIGEEMVLEFERARLINLDRVDLAERVSHHSIIIGDGLGYDILSYNVDGSERFIEVKTTKGGIRSCFYISYNELQTSLIKADNYYLYRVYDFSIEKKFGKLFICKGAFDKIIRLTPTEYRASF